MCNITWCEAQTCTKCMSVCVNFVVEHMNAFHNVLIFFLSLQNINSQALIESLKVYLYWIVWAFAQAVAPSFRSSQLNSMLSFIHTTKYSGLVLRSLWHKSIISVSCTLNVIKAHYFSTVAKKKTHSHKYIHIWPESVWLWTLAIATFASV